jgi:hypothetical protein
MNSFASDAIISIITHCVRCDLDGGNRTMSRCRALFIAFCHVRESSSVVLLHFLHLLELLLLPL